MDFGLPNQFNIRKGARYHEALQEWLDLAVVGSNQVNVELIQRPN